jgi:hypothetical protein
MMWKETIKALEDHFRDQHLATVYCSHLKRRIQLIGKPLQEFATAIKQLTYHTFPALHKKYIHREAFVDSIRE